MLSLKSRTLFARVNWSSVQSMALHSACTTKTKMFIDVYVLLLVVVVKPDRRDDTMMMNHPKNVRPAKKQTHRNNDMCKFSDAPSGISADVKVCGSKGSRTGVVTYYLRINFYKNVTKRLNKHLQDIAKLQYKKVNNFVSYSIYFHPVFLRI